MEKSEKPTGAADSKRTSPVLAEASFAAAAASVGDERKSELRGIEN